MEMFCPPILSSILGPRLVVKPRRCSVAWVRGWGVAGSVACVLHGMCGPCCSHLHMPELHGLSIYLPFPPCTSCVAVPLLLSCLVAGVTSRAVAPSRALWWLFICTRQTLDTHTLDYQTSSVGPDQWGVAKQVHLANGQCVSYVFIAVCCLPVRYCFGCGNVRAPASCELSTPIASGRPVLKVTCSSPAANSAVCACCMQSWNSAR
jgi:hypothetical protein